MNTISIAVQSEEFETINIELTSEEVLSLYKLRKEQSTKIQELEKKIKDLENSVKYNSDSRNELQNELTQAHVLLTALGVPLKTNEEDSWQRKDLLMGTRIALYIASKQ